MVTPMQIICFHLLTFIKLSILILQMKALLTDAIKTTEEDRHLAVDVETAKWELADSEKELQWLKSAFASSEKEHTHIQKDIDDVQLELDNER